MGYSLSASGPGGLKHCANELKGMNIELSSEFALLHVPSFGFKETHFRSFSSIVLGGGRVDVRTGLCAIRLPVRGQSG